MSEKKRSRRRKDEYTGPGEEQVVKPSKDEIRVAKWMKKNVKTKKTKFLSHNVEYFTANKAIDALMKSKFAEGDGALFTSREHAVDFLDLMLEHKFFHRAKKVPISIDELRGAGKPTKKEKDDSKAKEHAKEKSSRKEREEKRNGEAEAEASGANGASDEAGGTSASGDKKEKRKRKIRLDMHPEQIFVDGSEAYVWIYDPIPIHYWIYGLIMLLGAIGICMFPLWPSILRRGVYYLSLAAAGFLVFILTLTVVRLIIFTIVWAVTGGKLHLWIFPNLTEDVGFFASFWPLYESKYVTDAERSGKGEKRSKSKAKKKEKDSDAEDADDTAADAVPLEPEKIEEIKEHDADLELRHRNVTHAPDGGKGDTEEESHSGSSSAGEAAAESDTKCSHSESESEISGKDYEIISSSEVQNVK